MHLDINQKPHGQMSEAFLTAAFLSMSGGLQDAYTYIARGNVFANAQTGNIVLLSQSAFEGNWGTALHYLVPLLSFAFGVAAAEAIKQFFKRRGTRFFHWRHVVVVLEIVLLFAVGLMPGSRNLPANSMVSFACAMQVQAFRKVNGNAFASTMCIGNLRSGVEALYTGSVTHNRKKLAKAGHYFGIIFFFGIGAGIGSCLIPFLGMRTIWASCALLVASFVLMLIPEDEK